MKLSKSEILRCVGLVIRELEARVSGGGNMLGAKQQGTVATFLRKEVISLAQVTFVSYVHWICVK